jgi:coenzyme F420 hydrogenase subunit beta
MHNALFTIDEVCAFWDGVAPRYDDLNAGFSWTHVERFLTMQQFLPRRPGLAITNVWSRTGGAVPYIRQHCGDATLTNLEASDGMLAIARKRYPQETFLQTDLHDLHGDTASQDVVVSLETLEHVPDPLHFLLECHRLLKVGGRLILSAPPAWSETFLRIYECFFENHGEGPHKFPRVKSVLHAMRCCGFTVTEHRGTVLLPVGPQWAKRGAEWLQQRLLRHVGTNRLGIRHFYIAEKTAPRDPTWARLYEEVIRPGLCSRCGTCVGLSGGRLQFADRDGACLPEIVCGDDGAATELPAVCYDACPQVNPSYAAMNRAVFQTTAAPSPYFGHYRQLFVAHATDESVRRRGASGGVISAALLHLLAAQQIRGVVTLAMDAEAPWRCVPQVARTAEEVLAAAQSKYVVSPMNTILERLADEPGPLAFVGLPQQVFAIRRLQMLGHPSVAAIQYIFGPFFGNDMYGTAVTSFLRKFSARKEDVRRLSYREGEWPGKMTAWLGDGRVVEMPKFHANYLIPFHISDYSLLSQDLTNELSDLSGGDAWAPVYEQRGQGFSLIIARTQRGETLIEEMQQAGLLWTREISESEAVAMQSHGLDFKKRGGYLRMQQRRRRGLRTVDYGWPALPMITLKRAAFERLLGMLFRICAHPWARRAADAAPNWLIGPLFQWFRTVWKAATRKIKRGGLAQRSPTAAKPDAQ